jgi:hypothetical protein
MRYAGAFLEGNRLGRRLKDREDLQKYRIWKKALAPQY